MRHGRWQSQSQSSSHWCLDYCTCWQPNSSSNSQCPLPMSSKQVIQHIQPLQPLLECMKPLLCLIMTPSQESKHFLMFTLHWTPSLTWQQHPLLILLIKLNVGQGFLDGMSAPMKSPISTLLQAPLAQLPSSRTSILNMGQIPVSVLKATCKIDKLVTTIMQGNSEQWANGSLHHQVPHWWGQMAPDCSLPWIHIQQGHLCASPLQGSHAPCLCR